ncbi:MAG: FAD-dependent oxidoreductase [Lautropia sp.]
MTGERVDLLVAGAGTAGIPTAVFAARRGARVLLVEAQPRIGGTLHVSSGHMSAAGTRLQADRGIADSAQAHYDDVMRISKGTAHPTLLRVATTHAAATIDWLMAEGFDMGPECPVIAYSHEPYLVPRTYWGRDKGRSILAVLARLLDAAVGGSNAVDLRLGTRLRALHAADGGGWVARLATGESAVTVHAREVVLATGGYGANPELFSRVTGGYPLLSPAPVGADGSGLELALALGGRLQNQSIYLPTVAGVPDRPGGHALDWDRKSNLTPQHRLPWEIYVNLAGERFVAEDDPSPDARERALKRQSGLAFWVVFDQAMLDAAPPLFVGTPKDEILDRFRWHPAYRKADSVAALAQACGMDAAVMERTVARYNAAVADGNDPLGRRHLPAPIGRGPFHAIRHQGVTLRCWAGIEIDDSLRVVGGDGRPLPGLYAIGEIIGGAALSGDSFASGMSITPALTFGRLLGQQLLEFAR